MPPPVILREFDEIVPNGAERIMSAWEKESDHRRQLESRDLKITAFDILAGKLFALIFVLVALGAAVYSAVQGAEWVGAILGGGTIASVATAFIKTRNAANSPSKPD